MIDMCVKPVNSEGGEPPMNNSLSKKRKPLDDLSGVESKKNRSDIISCDAQENQEPHVTPPAAHQQVAHTMPDDALLIPSPPARRRSLLMWNPRLRGKDERRKVLKISISKLRLIDDPEVFLRRSVLVNNTLKRLQKEIRDEKSTQRFYDVRSAWRPLPEETCFETLVDSPAKRRREMEPEDLRQESSDEEIFGVSSEVVRVSLPKPASSSSSSSSSSESEDEASETQETSKSEAGSSSVNCATQYRRLEDSVSVLDSVVYHSLIASLES